MSRKRGPVEVFYYPEEVLHPVTRGPKLVLGSWAKESTGREERGEGGALGGISWITRSGV